MRKCEKEKVIKEEFQKLYLSEVGPTVENSSLHFLSKKVRINKDKLKLRYRDFVFVEEKRKLDPFKISFVRYQDSIGSMFKYIEDCSQFINKPSLKINPKSEYQELMIEHTSLLINSFTNLCVGSNTPRYFSWLKATIERRLRSKCPKETFLLDLAINTFPLQIIFGLMVQNNKFEMRGKNVFEEIISDSSKKIISNNLCRNINNTAIDKFSTFVRGGIYSNTLKVGFKTEFSKNRDIDIVLDKKDQSICLINKDILFQKFIDSDDSLPTISLIDFGKLLKKKNLLSKFETSSTLSKLRVGGILVYCWAVDAKKLQIDSSVRVVRENLLRNET